MKLDELKIVYIDAPISKCIKAGFMDKQLLKRGITALKSDSSIDVTSDCILAVIRYIRTRDKNNTDDIGKVTIDWNDDYDLKLSYEWIKKDD